MPKVWTGAKVLILGGAVAAGTVAAVASGMFDSGSGSGGLVPEEPAGVVAEEAGGPGEIDYNCSLPGKGAPWLNFRPGEPDEYVGDAPPAVFWSPLGTEIEFSMPIERDRDGGVDYAEVYETLCRVHPDLGGTEARELSEEEKRTFSDLKVYLGTGEQVPFYERGCLVTSTNWDGEVTWSRVGYHTRFNPDEFHCEPDPDPPGLDGQEVEGRWDGSWEGFYTDSAGLATGVYWLPPIPREWLDELASGDQGGTAASEGEGADEAAEEEDAEMQRWRVRLSGSEIDERIPDPSLRIFLEPDHRMAARFDYEIEAEVTIRRIDGEWVFGSGVITESLVSVEAQYSPESAWVVSPERWLDVDDDLSPPDRALSGQVDDGKIRLEWGTLGAAVEIEAMHARSCPPNLCEDRYTTRHYSMGFLASASDRWIPLQDGHSGRWEQDRRSSWLGPSRQVVTVVIGLERLD